MTSTTQLDDPRQASGCQIECVIAPSALESVRSVRVAGALLPDSHRGMSATEFIVYASVDKL